MIFADIWGKYVNHWILSNFHEISWNFGFSTKTSGSFRGFSIGNPTRIPGFWRFPGGPPGKPRDFMKFRVFDPSGGVICVFSPNLVKIIDFGALEGRNRPSWEVVFPKFGNDLGRISCFFMKLRVLGGRFRPIIRVLGHENEGLWLVVGGWAPTIGYSRRL